MIITKGTDLLTHSVTKFATSGKLFSTSKYIVRMSFNVRLFPFSELTLSLLPNVALQNALEPLHGSCDEIEQYDAVLAAIERNRDLICSERNKLRDKGATRGRGRGEHVSAALGQK